MNSGRRHLSDFGKRLFYGDVDDDDDDEEDDLDEEKFQVFFKKKKTVLTDFTSWLLTTDIY